MVDPWAEVQSVVVFETAVSMSHTSWEGFNLQDAEGSSGNLGRGWNLSAAGRAAGGAVLVRTDDRGTWHLACSLNAGACLLVPR